MAIIRVPPRRSPQSNTQISIGLPGSVAAGQAAVADAKDNLSNTLVSNALQAMKMLAPKETQVDLTNAKLNAKLKAEEMIIGRLNQRFDENGNFNYDSIPTDLAELTRQAYEEIGSTLPPEAQKQWKKTTQNEIVRSQIRGLKSRQAASIDAQQYTANRSFNDLMTQAGDLDRPIESIKQEYMQQSNMLQGQGADLSQLDTVQRSQVRQLEQERFKALLATNPDAAQEFIPNMTLTPSEAAQHIDMVERRRIELVNAQNAIDKPTMSEVQKRIDNGVKAPDELLADLDRIIATNDQLSDPAAVLAVKYHATNDFNKLSPDAQDRVIEQLRTGKPSKLAFELLQSFEKTRKHTKQLRQKDPTGYAIQQGLISDTGVLEPGSENFRDHLDTKKRSGNLLTEQYGVESSGLTRLDMKAMREYYAKADSNARMDMIKDVVATYGTKSRTVFGEMLNEDVQDSGSDHIAHMAMVGMLTLYNLTDTAETALMGRHLRDNKLIDMPTDAQFNEAGINNYVPADLLPVARAAQISLIKDIYAQLAKDEGHFDSTEANEELLEKAAVLANMGESVSDTGDSTGLIEVNGPGFSDHEIMRPAPEIKSEEDFEKWMTDISEEEWDMLGSIKGLEEITGGETAGVTRGAAQQFIMKGIKDGTIYPVSIGLGRYVLWHSPDRDTLKGDITRGTDHGGPLGPSGAAMIHTSNGEPLIIDYGVIEDHRNGVERPNSNKGIQMGIDDEVQGFSEELRKDIDNISNIKVQRLSQRQVEEQTPTSQELKGTQAYGQPDKPQQQDTRQIKEIIQSSSTLNSQQVHTLNKKTNFSEVLGHYTMQNDNVGYTFGAKSVASGGIDCSGWVAQNTLRTVKMMDPRLHAKLKPLLSTAAAYQIKGIGNITGITSNAAIRSGKIEPGMLIGMRFSKVPGWAKGRPYGISHIVQVVSHNGRLMISESSSSKGGVSLTPLKTWLKGSGRNAILYGVNPFKVR